MSTIHFKRVSGIFCVKSRIDMPFIPAGKALTAFKVVDGLGTKSIFVVDANNNKTLIFPDSPDIKLLFSFVFDQGMENRGETAFLKRFNEESSSFNGRVTDRYIIIN